MQHGVQHTTHTGLEQWLKHDTTFIRQNENITCHSSDSAGTMH
jgi:hypothetical protein